MGLESITELRDKILKTGGKNLLNIRYPDEFEVYMCALELVDKDFKTIEYFIFPILPNSLTESQNEITSVKKTAGGITVLSNPQFIPVDITLNGTFGRSFKFLVGSNYKDLLGTFQENGKVTLGSIYRGLKKPELDKSIKTGYGCIKLLESIVKQAKSSGSDSTSLIFYNLAFGNHYLVKVQNLTTTQSVESNMMWNYTLQMKGVAPLEGLTLKEGQVLRSDEQLSTDAAIQKKVVKVVSRLNSIKRNILPNFIPWK